MNHNDCAIVICSTPESKRLHKKCFMRINGKTTLEHIFDRIESANIRTFLAIPDNLTYTDYHRYKDVIGNRKIGIYEGDPNSPLHRTYYLLKHYPDIKYYIRITHDDILIDVQTMLEVLDKVKKYNAGYGISPAIVDGAGIEVISIDNLNHAGGMLLDSVEHISYFVKGENCPNSEIYIHIPRETIQRQYRLTLDYYEDYVVLNTIFKRLGNDCTVDQICEYLDMNNHILKYNKMPEVTLYTCVYNGEKFIHDTINSTFNVARNCEYIIIDDCSTDNTLEVISYHSADKDIRIICNESNKGLASSSNIAISQARGKYIMRIDADDMIKYDTITKMKDVMQKTDSMICYSNYDMINDRGKIVKKNISAMQCHHAGCALMNKRWLNEIRFKEGIKHWDSLELYKRINERFNIAYIYEPLWYYRIHGSNISGEKNNAERKKCKP